MFTSQDSLTAACPVLMILPISAWTLHFTESTLQDLRRWRVVLDRNESPTLSLPTQLLHGGAQFCLWKTLLPRSQEEEGEGISVIWETEEKSNKDLLIDK